MQVFLFRMELALKCWGVSLCCCQLPGLGRWDSRAVRGASTKARGGRIMSVLVIPTPFGYTTWADSTVVKVRLLTPQWSSCGCVVLTRGPCGTPHPSSMNETLSQLHALRTRL